MKGSVSMRELGHLVVLVRPSNLAHSRCVLFASLYAFKMAFDVNKRTKTILWPSELSLEIFVSV